VPTKSVVPGLLALGWDDGWASALSDLDDGNLSPGRVSRVDRGLCTVMTGTAEVRASAERGVEVAVGDWVGMDLRPTSQGPTSEGPPSKGPTQIVAILPRRHVFRREAPSGGGSTQIVAANIDTVLVCNALDGGLSLRHLERFLALAWQSGATPVVLMTKSDAVPPAVVAEAVKAVEGVANGVSIVVVSSTAGGGMVDLAPYLVAGRTVALLGLSGAGKSTLVNLLAGGDILATGAVRKDGSGRHTTTHRELVVLPGGGLLIDTPGMRALSVEGAGGGVALAFGDIEEMAQGCEYAGCSHTGEIGCALLAALNRGSLDRGRFESWLRLRAEPASVEIDATRRGIEERKRRKAKKVADRRAART